MNMLFFTFSFLAGCILGTVYFLGLLWTVQKGLTEYASPFLFPVSLILRTSVVVAGFYFVSGGDWRRMLFCLAGFVAARIFILRFTGTTPEVNHASHL